MYFIFCGFSYDKANNTFLSSLRKNDVEARKLNLRERIWKGLGSPAIDVSVKKISLVVRKGTTVPAKHHNCRKPPS